MLFFFVYTFKNNNKKFKIKTQFFNDQLKTRNNLKFDNFIFRKNVASRLS